MIKLKIDNRTFEVEADRTILSIAEEGGIKIPTLCHFEGIDDDASCLVCTVIDKRDGSYIPACSTIAVDGMNIDTTSQDVISFRKRMVELLITEHRAECEAPCNLNCPHGYNTTLLIKYLSAGKIKDALSLVASETGIVSLACDKCEGFCEQSCRRGAIDSPISIKAIRRFLYVHLGESSIKADDINKSNIQPSDNKFISKTGYISLEEQKEWLKECSDDAQRFCDIADYISAGLEAKSCLRCECRAANDCRLRELATELEIKDSGEKLQKVPIQKKISTLSNLIFENAKCIKCGLCTRACNDSDGRTALCFKNRGSYLTISEPIGIDFYYIPADKAKIYMNVCPTGALREYKAEN